MRLRNSLSFISLKSFDLSYICIVFLSALFLGGCLAGLRFSVFCAENYRADITEYLSDFCETAKIAVPQATFFRTLVSFLLYPVAVFCVGLSPLGVVVIPLLSIWLGFGVTFTVQCFVCVFSRAGILPALALFSVRLIVILACFFALAVEAFPQAWRIARVTIRNRGRCETVCRGSRIIFLSLLCLVALIMGACCEKLLTPVLFRLALTRIT